MVKATLSDLAFSSILHDLLFILSGAFQTGNRTIGFEVFLKSHHTQNSQARSQTVTGTTSLISDLESYQNHQAPSRLSSYQSGGRDVPPPRTPVVGTAAYDRRRRITANPPKPTARSERAEGSGTEGVDSPIFSLPPL